MDFTLTKEHKDIQKAAQEFAVGEFKDVARECDLKEIFPKKILDKARQLDLIGLFIPEEYGGPGLGYLEHALVLEEFWKIDPGIGQRKTAARRFAAETTPKQHPVIHHCAAWPWSLPVPFPKQLQSVLPGPVLLLFSGQGNERTLVRKPLKTFLKYQFHFQ